LNELSVHNPYLLESIINYYDSPKLGELFEQEERITAAQEQIESLQGDLTALGEAKDAMESDHGKRAAEYEATLATVRDEKSALEGELRASKEALDGMVVQSEVGALACDIQ
jgi:predicted  nucleic acid-binding Zn-ribbon protein